MDVTAFDGFTRVVRTPPSFVWAFMLGVLCNLLRKIIRTLAIGVAFSMSLQHRAEPWNSLLGAHRIRTVHPADRRGRFALTTARH